VIDMVEDGLRRKAPSAILGGRCVSTRSRGHRSIFQTKGLRPIRWTWGFDSPLRRDGMASVRTCPFGAGAGRLQGQARTISCKEGGEKGCCTLWKACRPSRPRESRSYQRSCHSSPRVAELAYSRARPRVLR
jgi:hypothetical protein